MLFLKIGVLAANASGGYTRGRQGKRFLYFVVYQSIGVLYAALRRVYLWIIVNVQRLILAHVSIFSFMHELVAWLFETEQGLSHFLNNLISEHLCCHWFSFLLLPFEVPLHEISSVKEVLLRKILNIARDGIQKMFPPQEDSLPSYTCLLLEQAECHHLRSNSSDLLLWWWPSWREKRVAATL